MLGNGIEMSLIFCRIHGPLVLGWAPNHFVLGAQLGPGAKKLVCIPELICHCFIYSWVKVFRIVLEFRILMLTFHKYFNIKIFIK